MTNEQDPLVGNEDAIRSERSLREKDSTILRREVLKRPISDLKPRAPVCLQRETAVATAIETMRRNDIGCVLVVDGEILAGIFTERDVLKKVAATALDPRRTRVHQVMTPNPQTLRLENRIAFAFNKMSVGGFRHLPLVDEAGRPVGVISVKDLIRFLVDFFPGEVMNISPDADRKFPTRAEGG